MSRPSVAILSSSWIRAPRGEKAAATRSIAGALSRLSSVDIFVPGAGPPVPDGAFDLIPVEGAGGRPSSSGDRSSASGGWPRGAAVPATPYRVVLVEAGDRGAVDLAASVAPDAPVLEVGRAIRIVATTPAGKGPRQMTGTLAVDPPPDTDQQLAGRAIYRTGLYARIDPGARARRHYGLRAIADYVLVLGERPGVPVDPWPSPRTSWLLARFPRRSVVVVEGALARVWRSRSCIAEFEVHSRTDLWILMAQATGVVDLRPGGLFARECVESLRYGVPVVVPAGSAADGLARAGGGLRFSTTAELLSCVDALFDAKTCSQLASDGRAAADHWYGDPDGLVQRLDAVLHAVETRRGAGGRSA
jgi:hypothetical protein